MFALVFVPLSSQVKMMSSISYKIVYCTPALYSAGGVERVVSFKASYFAEQLGYDVTIIVTEGRGRACFFPLSDKVKVVNFELGFEDLWKAPFLRKVFLYLSKQRKYKKRLSLELMRIRPDITISMLRREINFLTSLKDGSKKIGELHVNRANYRNFESNDSNPLKRLFSWFWMKSLVVHLKKLDQLVVLTEKSMVAWPELENVTVIPDPIPLPLPVSHGTNTKRVITIGRYAYQKGYDLLLQAWAEIEKIKALEEVKEVSEVKEWTLDIYGQGDRTDYRQLMVELGIDTNRCHLNGPVDDVGQVYMDSSIFVLSSRFEGFGLVLVEAMASGMSVVSFDCPAGPDEIITDGYDGLLVPPGDVKVLAQKLMLLMADENLRTRLSQNACQSAQRYEMNLIAGKWVDLFNKLMEKS